MLCPVRSNFQTMHVASAFPYKINTELHQFCACVGTALTLEVQRCFQTSTEKFENMKVTHNCTLCYFQIKPIFFTLGQPKQKLFEFNKSTSEAHFCK